jgi:hypothetical protein
MKKKI